MCIKNLIETMYLECSDFKWVTRRAGVFSWAVEVVPPYE